MHTPPTYFCRAFFFLRIGLRYASGMLHVYMMVKVIDAFTDVYGAINDNSAATVEIHSAC